jgi:hypothetical protein
LGSIREPLARLLGRARRRRLGALAPAILLAAVGLGGGCKSEKAASLASTPPLQGGRARLGDILVNSVTQSVGTPHLNSSVSEKPLSIGGQGYPTGFGTHSTSRIEISFPDKYKTLTGSCGVDDEVQNHGSVVFKVLDGKKVLFESALMKGKMKAADFSVPVNGMTGLSLIVENGGDDDHFDHADWVNLNLK